MDSIPRTLKHATPPLPQPTPLPPGSPHQRKSRQPQHDDHGIFGTVKLLRPSDRRGYGLATGTKRVRVAQLDIQSNNHSRDNNIWHPRHDKILQNHGLPGSGWHGISSTEMANRRSNKEVQTPNKDHQSQSQFPSYGDMRRKRPYHSYQELGRKSNPTTYNPLKTKSTSASPWPQKEPATSLTPAKPLEILHVTNHRQAVED